ncbi:MAG: enamine deaminase RidA (YjgF/YER057c/UK114 family) [Rickettsiales bacterium]|jgi:enamine deaminase RidA (YjgF/YER057c/UK114 family)
MTFIQKLEKLGIALPKPIVPIANYVPFVKTGNQVFISGQVPIQDGEVKFVGKLGKNISIEDGQKAARICAINILTNLNLACDGDLERVVRCVKLGIFVNSDPEFTDQPIVANGASDLMVEVFGEKGKHSRFAMGASSLPRGVAVEVDAIFEIS